MPMCRTVPAIISEKRTRSGPIQLRPAAFTGRLCFAPSLGQRVRFTRPDTWLAASGPPVDPQAAPAAAPAQQTPPQPPAWSPAQNIGMFAFPKNGQSADQQLKDESECYGMAKQRTGIDAQTPPPTGLSNRETPRLRSGEPMFMRSIRC